MRSPWPNAADPAIDPPRAVLADAFEQEPLAAVGNAVAFGALGLYAPPMAVKFSSRVRSVAHW
jgi:hypothetical protein